MTIETELRALVSFYTPFNAEEGRYTITIERSKLIQLDASFIKWINQKLLADGPIKTQIEKNYKKLMMHFHPDRLSYFTPETHWLEAQLSEGKNNGVCFKTLSCCYEKLTQPAKFKEIEFSGINSKEDCKRWLEKLKSRSSTYSNRSLCDSLINLLDESSHYFDSTGTIKPSALKILVQFIPTIIASYGASLLIEELLAIYAIYFVILKGTERLEKSDFTELHKVGLFMQNYTSITAMMTTTLLIRILEMLFWTSRQCWSLTLQISSTLFTPLIASHKNNISKEVPIEAICNELELVAEDQSKGMMFDTPELKIIAAPFEKYLTLNTQQFFGGWRVGHEKRKLIDNFLFQLRVLDKLPRGLDDKYTEVTKELETIKADKNLYNGKTAEVVTYAEHILSLLKSTIIIDNNEFMRSH